jgi:hypothetical protein
MTEPTVNVVFSWQTFMPDHRQFKQNSIVLTPQDTLVIVKVPIKIEYVVNADKVLAESLYANAVRPTLTPLGMRYVMDQLEAVLPDVPLKSDDFNPDTEDEFESDTTTSDDEFETVEDEEDEWKLD